MIGLYFAVPNTFEDEIPCVWILDPFWLNGISVGDTATFMTDELTREEGEEFIDAYRGDSKELPELPLAVTPSYSNIRLAAQKSVFTIHGKRKDGFADAARVREEPHLAQLVIDAEVTETIRSDVELSGITESTLFPDLEGLAREMKNDYGVI